MAVRLTMMRGLRRYMEARRGGIPRTVCSLLWGSREQRSCSVRDLSTSRWKFMIPRPRPPPRLRSPLPIRPPPPPPPPPTGRWFPMCSKFALSELYVGPPLGTPLENRIGS
eukprot:9500442-Pyramimonas_sp.AAC.1